MVKEELFVLSLPYDGNKDRTIRVFVPEHEKGEAMPVIYMTDGQNLFEDDTVVFGCWYTREAVRAETVATGRKAVIVGIHNDGDPLERTIELMPKSMGSLVLPPDIPEELKGDYTPLGEVFDDFVINTVMPAVEKQFPVKEGRKYTAFCGSSSGGLESFFTALSHPDKFSAAGVFSPVYLMYDKGELESWIRGKVKSADEFPFLYMYMGGGDDLERQLYPDFEWVSSILEDCAPSASLKKVYTPENVHNEGAWETSFKDLLHIFLSQ